MSNNQKGLIIRNAFFLTIAQGSSRVLYGIIAILLIRYLGKASFDQYATATVFMAMFAMLPSFGFNNVMLRECSLNTASLPMYFGATIVWNSIFAIGGFGLAGIIAYLRFDSEIFLLSMILGVRLFLMAMLATFHTVFQAYQRMHVTSIMIVVSNIIAIIAIVIAMLLGGSVFLVAILMAVASIVTLLIALVVTLRVVSFAFNSTIFKTIVKPAFHFGINNVMSMLYIQGNVFILSLYKMEFAVGTYNSAFRLIAMFELIPQIVSTALFPAIYARANDDKKLITAIHQVIRYLFPVGILLAVICCVNSSWIIDTLFGSDFEEAAPVLTLLSLGIMLRFNLVILSNVLYAKRKERYLTCLMSFLAFTNTLSCILLLPRYGAIGAASIYLVVQTMFWIINTIRVEMMFNWPQLWKNMVIPGTVGLVLFCLGSLLNIPAMIMIPIVPLLYYGILVAVKYYTVNEIVSLLHLVFARNR